MLRPVRIAAKAEMMWAYSYAQVIIKPKTKWEKKRFKSEPQQHLWQLFHRYS
jgi:hypothetical protein